MIRTDCPHCGQGYNVADSQLGKTAMCKSCSSPFEVRQAGTQKANGAHKAPYPEQEEDRPVRQRRREEEDEDARPVRRRSRDEDEYEDDRPARRRSRDEDYDDRPARRRRREDDEDEDDRPPRRRGKAGQTKLLLWLGIGGGGALLLLVILVVVLVLVLGGSSVSQANYEKLKNGMTVSEVKAILGKPYDERDMMGSKVLTWKSGDNVIQCSFMNDKLMIKGGTIDGKLLLGGGGDGGGTKIDPKDFFPKGK